MLAASDEHAERGQSGDGGGGGGSGGAEVHNAEVADGKARAMELAFDELVRGHPEPGDNGDNGDIGAAAAAWEPPSSISLSKFRAPRAPPRLFAPELGLGASLVALDLSRNELRAPPPGLGGLAALRSLNLSRNFLRCLSAELAQLARLESLDVSSNQLRPTALFLEALATLPALRTVDLQHNNGLWEPAHAAELAATLGARGVACPISLRAPKSAKSHAADRDATLLRSQLEPHSTGVLRRRLALSFGETTDPELVDRAELMEKLLAAYAASEQPGQPARAVRRIEGTPVSAAACDALEDEMWRWAAASAVAAKAEGFVRERTNIRAEHYMILSAPGRFSGTTSRPAVRAAEKLAAHAKLWDLAKVCCAEVDPEYAEEYTAVAFTCNFQGSPHIDTQNLGTFRGLALGDFEAGGGALAVECSAREVAHVDTRRRLGKVDGRYPHWVEPFASGTRFSVIYYRTAGAPEPRTTAVFQGEPLVDEPATFCAKAENYYNRYDRATNTYDPIPSAVPVPVPVPVVLVSPPLVPP